MFSFLCGQGVMFSFLCGYGDCHSYAGEGNHNSFFSSSLVVGE